MVSIAVVGILAVLALSGVESLPHKSNSNTALNKVLNSIRQTRSVGPSSPNCAQATECVQRKPVYLITLQPQQPRQQYQVLPPLQPLQPIQPIQPIQPLQPLQPLQQNPNFSQHYQIHQQVVEEAKRKQGAWQNQINAANQQPARYRLPPASQNCGNAGVTGNPAQNLPCNEVCCSGSPNINRPVNNKPGCLVTNDDNRRNPCSADPNY